MRGMLLENDLLIKGIVDESYICKRSRERNRYIRK